MYGLRCCRPRSDLGEGAKGHLKPSSNSLAKPAYRAAGRDRYQADSEVDFTGPGTSPLEGEVGKYRNKATVLGGNKALT